MAPFDMAVRHARVTDTACYRTGACRLYLYVSSGGSKIRHFTDWQAVTHVAGRLSTCWPQGGARH